MLGKIREAIKSIKNKMQLKKKRTSRTREHSEI